MICDKAYLNNQTIYQVFVRQFSPKHDFNGVTKQLDRIKALGADILYLMPFYPIGKVNRKGEVGSPYAIYDYTKIDPMNGTEQDFANLLNEAHKRGLKVIIDMVLNHTSRDSVLLQQHEDWFYHVNGKPANKVGDWGDVYDLDYSKQELCDKIIDILSVWVKKGVDGFRMDVCSLVPALFWKQAVDALHKINPNLIMLGESVEINFVRELRRLGCNAMSDGEAYNYFDLLYVYDIHDTQSAFVERKGGSLGAWLKDVLNQEGRYPINYVKARYLDNHDRERAAKFWSGDKLKMLWALNFYLKGTAFVYAGDETSFDKQNDLFEIDEVKWSFNDAAKDISAYIANLAAIKKHDIYSHGFFDIVMQGEQTAVCSYTNKESLSVGVFNFEDGEVTVGVKLQDGDYKNLITGKTVTVQDGKLAIGNEPIVIEQKL
ncbi:MAG: alpha-amylase [Clostridiales bacterium]|nr:alpha-amylase [Clostridiales bacterium]